MKTDREWAILDPRKGAGLLLPKRLEKVQSMLDQSEQNYYFVQHANISEEENKRSDQDEVVQSMARPKAEPKADRLNRWIDSVDH